VDRYICVQSVLSPLLANIYLHYVYDLWVQRWRRRCAQGDVIAVRYADDVVVEAHRVGQQRQQDTEQSLRVREEQRRGPGRSQGHSTLLLSQDERRRGERGSWGSMAPPMAMIRATMPSMCSVDLSLAGSRLPAGSWVTATFAAMSGLL
jgi:hypothetical protein